jgi:hypothetical protein
MLMIMKMTDAGRRALRLGQLSHRPDQELVLEVLDVTGEIEDDNLHKLICELEERFGDSEAALDAIRHGEVQFNRMH